MKKIKLATLFLPLGISMLSCKKDVADTNNDTTAAAQTSAFANYRVCTEMHPDEVSARRGATLKNTLWPKGSKIKVSLNGGSPFVRSKVIEHASKWEQYANIDFDFVSNDSKAPIRVTFDTNDGSWSYLGVQAKGIPSREATMNFGWFTDRTSDEEFRRTTIHEFGHALGMIHEQQHPLVTIPWDKPAVYAYYARSGWDKATVDRNLFTKYTTAQTNFSAYDRTSIMHYPVDENMTIGNYSVGWNTDLSATDKAFIASVYPK